MNTKRIAPGLAALLLFGTVVACGEDDPGQPATTMADEMSDESMADEEMTDESMADETMTDETTSG